jgi:hypothetical protein
MAVLLLCACVAALGTCVRSPAPPPKSLPPAEAGWLPARPATTWTHVVIHHSASAEGNADLFDRWHKANDWDGLGYHFVIGNGRGSGDGQIEVGYRWTRQARGAHTDGQGLGSLHRDEPGYYNAHGIGICLVGNFQETSPTARQMAALAKLCRFLTACFGVPGQNIIGHRDTKNTTECPGRNFSIADLRRRL